MTRRGLLNVVAWTVVLGGAGWLVARLSGHEPQPVQASLSLEETLGGQDTAGFERALAPRPFDFPADHGPHPDFRNEWWYLTGNLETGDGRRFGYQLTLFRTALAASMPERASEWATRQAWMGHFALTDVAAGRFHAFERFARGMPGIAEATADPFRVSIEDWSLRSVNGAGDTTAAGHRSRGASSIFPISVIAARDDVAIDLRIDAGDAIVLNGDSGLSRKGKDPGNASYYYSFMRLPTAGRITVGNDTFTVTGDTWLDREWSTSALAPGVVGWDWFAIQLDDATGLMLYGLRRTDGSADPFSAGTFVAADGSVSHLDADDFTIDVTDQWDSPLDGARYPGAWTLRVPDLDLELDVSPVIADQEHHESFRYWEGAVNAAGTRGPVAVSGRGYVELTGYAGEAVPARSGAAEPEHPPVRNE